MKTNFDYIIIGAGSAGCVLAARLTEDADVTVALVEAGDSDNAPEIDAPRCFRASSRHSSTGISPVSRSPH